MASHLIDCDGLSVCGSSTRTTATGITDIRSDHGTPRTLAPLVTSTIKDRDSAGVSTPRTGTSWVSDIEHVCVNDDPRKWSRKLKACILYMAFSASMVAGLSGSILNPAIKQIETDLKATSSQIGPVLATHIIIQGVGPVLWTPISEIKGRKPVYIVSIVISLIGYIVAAKAKTIGVLIGMRAVQAIGTSSFIAISAATLADIYDPAERGKVMGIFYAAPLLGPSLGPILGGILTQAFSWRANFWLLSALLGANLVLFTFFRDTFRCERSLTYRRALARRGRAIVFPRFEADAESITVPVATLAAVDTIDSKEKAGLGDGPESPSSGGAATGHDMQAEITLSLADVNPFPPLLLVLRRRNNIVTLIASGLLFAFGYCIAYTCSRTLSDAYNYDALRTGLVLLSFGAGSMLGSVLGGRWSDRELRRLTRANGGHHSPEMRLESTKPAALLLPLACIAYAWLAQKQAHVAALCIALFFSGFFSIWIYSSTLAYIVDANPGRSSAVVATNSCFRGVAAFVFTLVAVPLQDSADDGGLYTLWAGLLVLSELLLWVVRVHGGPWRVNAEECEKTQSFSSSGGS